MPPITCAATYGPTSPRASGPLRHDEADGRIEVRAGDRPEDEDQNHEDGAGRQRVAEQREADVLRELRGHDARADDGRDEDRRAEHLRGEAPPQVEGRHAALPWRAIVGGAFHGADLGESLLQRGEVLAFDVEIDELGDPRGEPAIRLHEGGALFRVRALDGGGIGNAPMGDERMAGPIGADLAGGAVADGDDEVHRRRPGAGELVPALRPEALPSRSRAPSAGRARAGSARPWAGCRRSRP